MQSKKNEDIRRIQKKIISVLKRNNVVRAGIFGSYARGESKKGSDIDILIKVRKGKKFSLFDLVGLQMELEEKLGKKVDLLTYNGISPYLKKYILEDEIKII
ncbi:nucleotidyltransferase family protein [Candidatus Woesearchaeota archaeon]|nr:nucleotidyltransferase family protein [Candidatus Woesearchaeota archaeon]